MGGIRRRGGGGGGGLRGWIGMGNVGNGNVDCGEEGCGIGRGNAVRRWYGS